MSRAFLVLLFLSSWLITRAAIAADNPLPGASLAYLPNHGQWPSAVRLRADVAPGLTVFAENHRLTFLRFDAAAWAAGAHAQQATRTPPHSQPVGGSASSVPAHAWAVEFANAAANASPHPEGQPTGPIHNYFLGADSTHWAAGVRATPAARYAQLWPGIDLRLHASATGDFEYDLELAPGANPAHIGLRYRGLHKLWLDATGCLHLRTALGELTEAAPVAWQPDDHGGRHNVPVRFVLKQESATALVSFELPTGYDATRRLVIDPVLTFATYSGSTAPVFGHTATYDASGHLYAAGPCYDPGYPTTTGVFDLIHSNGQITGGYDNPDVAISRYSSDGKRLLYATYLGGEFGDLPHSLLVNHHGDLLILGTTFSRDFPTTATGYDRSLAGFGSSDAFVARLDSMGAHLLGSTYLGGAADDGRATDALRFFYGDNFRGDLAVDSLDRVYLATATVSADFPFTPGAVHPPTGFSSAAVVARFAPDLSALHWAAGLGQTAVAYGLYLPRSGAPYVVGTTRSTGLATTAGTLSPAVISPIQQDGFVMQLSPGGDTIRAGTYLRPPNGRATSQSFFVQGIPGSADIAVLGSSTGFYPATPGTWNQRGGGLIIQRLTADLRQRAWVTTIGHPVSYGNSANVTTDNLSPTAFEVDKCGAIYLSAWGNTRNLLVSPTAFQRQTDGQDLYLAVLQPDATSLQYATFLGGHSSNQYAEEHVDGGTSRFDPQGRIYQAICTNAHDFPTTSTAWRTSNRVVLQQYDEVACKLDFEPRLVRAAAAAANANGGGPITNLEAPATIQFTNTSTNYPGTTYQWLFGDGSPSDFSFAPQHTYLLPGTYQVTLIAQDPGACGGADTTHLTIVIQEDDSTDLITYTICRGDSVQFAPIEAQPGTFHWTPSLHLSSDVTPNPWAAPPTTTSYAATGTLSNSTRRNTWRVTVQVVQPDSVGLTVERQCYPTGIEARFTLSQPLRNVTWDFGDGQVASIPDTTLSFITHFYVHEPPGRTHIAHVTGRDSHNCPVQIQQFIVTDALFVPNVITPGNADGSNDTFQVGCLTPGTVTLQVYNRWGRLVYDSAPNQYHNQWNGDGLPAGIYYYYLRVDYAPVPFKGWVEIIR